MFNKLGPEGGKAIAEALKSGTSVLTKLNVGYNNLGHEEKQQLRDAVKGREGFELEGCEESDEESDEED